MQCMFCFHGCALLLDLLDLSAQRCALPAGGRDEGRHFAGTSFEPRKLPENAQTPTRRVHAVLGSLMLADTKAL